MVSSPGPPARNVAQLTPAETRAMLDFCLQKCEIIGACFFKPPSW